MLPLSVRLAPSRFLDPLLIALVVCGVALFLALREEGSVRRSARVGRALAWVAWGGLWVLSMPMVSNLLTVWTEERGPSLEAALAGKDHAKVALVVLAGGLRTYDTTLPPRERLDAAATQRVLTAARLWNEQHFGLVVLSGSPAPETEAMQDLATTLGVPADRIVREPASRNTRENATFSAAILRDRGFAELVVVTSATHLRRAMKDFDATGLHAIPAAADIVGRARWGIDTLLPSSYALARTHVALHEILGYLHG